MNKVCAAGTGSFLEEQAEKLDISIKAEIRPSRPLLGRPCEDGERCTVFIESDLVHHQQKGSEKDDLVAGLSYSIVQNYLNRVVGDRRIGNRIFFRGDRLQQRRGRRFREGPRQRDHCPGEHDVTRAIGGGHPGQG